LRGGEEGGGCSSEGPRSRAVWGQEGARGKKKKTWEDKADAGAKTGLDVKGDWGRREINEEGRM